MRAIFARKYKDYAKGFGRLPCTLVKLLPYELPLTIIIYLDRLVITCWSEDIIAIRILDKRLVQEALEQFKYFWRAARQI